jgi:hypothetical protein
MAKNAQDVAAKYQRRVQAAQPDYEAGVRNPAGSWSGNYKAAEGRMANAYQQALSEGRMRRGVDKVGDTGWQAATLAKASHYSQSAQTAATKYAEQLPNILAAGDAGMAASKQIDGSTFEGRLDKMRANAVAISNFWKTKR